MILGRVELLSFLSKSKPHLPVKPLNYLTRPKILIGNTEKSALAANTIRFGNGPVANVSFMLRQSETHSTPGNSRANITDEVETLVCVVDTRCGITSRLKV